MSSGDGVPLGLDRQMSEDGSRWVPLRDPVDTDGMHGAPPALQYSDDDDGDGDYEGHHGRHGDDDGDDIALEEHHHSDTSTATHGTVGPEANPASRPAHARERNNTIARHTSKGVPYLYDPAIDDPAMEHARVNLSLCVPLKEIETRYGAGTRMYYSFLKFVMVTNALLVCIALVSWIPFLQERRELSSDPQWDAEDLFVSRYTEDQRKTWLISGYLSMFVWLVSPGLWYLFVRYRHEEERDHDNIWSMMGTEEIEENQHLSRGTRIKYRLLSYAIFVIMLTASGTVVWFLILLQKRLEDDNTDSSSSGSVAAASERISFGIAIAVSIAIAIMNAMWQFVCYHLTVMERHQTWSAFRSHNSVKLVLWKILNVTALYVAIAVLLRQDDDACSFQDAGTKFLVLLLVDMTVNNVAQLLAHPLKRCLLGRICPNKLGDEDDRAEFDVADEFLQVFYRQFLIYLGMFVFPMIALLGLLANLLEYPLDKARMLKLCQQPKRIPQKMTGFLIFFLFFVTIAAFVSWPNGGLWLMFVFNRGSLNGLAECRVLRAP